MDPYSQDIGRDGVDGRECGDALGGSAEGALVEACVVDYAVERAERVDLFCDVFCLREVGEVAGHDGGIGAGTGGGGVVGALRVAGVENDRVSAGDETLGDEGAEAV